MGNDDLSDDGSQAGEKKRRLNMEQVKTLEKNFELGNKLEPERKMQLARALGLQPRQIAIWFQNRRARWKTKQLEKDYEVLKRQFEAIKADNDALQAQNQKLHAGDTRFTNLRVSVISGLTGQDRSDFSYKVIKDVQVVPRFIGEWGDIVITLKDGTKVDLRSVPKFREIAKYCLSSG
ncbi:hypothetical protein F0562_032883 [Nyssa sinensis]|uniref:Homeobox-leucine zipper protein n=1 Tax=Nyssa sinensis TaxID=561372 RepID=A0A5J5AR23_9ASTE|nr:hypothetical protein F0562_032883 [Nyssa sinensis]